MNKKELEKLFHQHGVFDATQFIISARESLVNALNYKEIINSLNVKIHDENEMWRQNMSLVPMDGNPNIKQIVFDERPDFNIDIAGVSVSMFYLQNMFIKAFFQECRNTLDILAQAANAACLAFKAKKIETVDFSMMNKVFHQQTYQTAFPDVCKWFGDISGASEFVYVDNYCNRTKHTCSVQTKFELPVFGETTQSTILPFFRLNKDETKQHTKQEIDSFITKIYDFFSDAYSNFFTIIKQEIEKETFIENRYYTLSVYQQKFKEDANSDFSLAYLKCESDIDSMPDEIQVLLVAEMLHSEKDIEIVAKNCPFNTIYIKDVASEKVHHYIGKYVAEYETGEDNLFRFRKYRKVVPTSDDYNYVIEAMRDESTKGIFYHKNPFVSIETCSDDEGFLARIELPF